jgi:hexokinase
MSFFSFIKNNEFKSGHALVLDVGGGSVGVAIANFIEDKSPEIIFSVRKQLPVQLKLSNHRMLSVMSSVLDDVLALAMDKLVYLKDLNKGESIKINKIFCTVSSPWNVDSTKSVNFSLVRTKH